jgi:hypothetical protein
MTGNAHQDILGIAKGREQGAMKDVREHRQWMSWW